MKLKIAGKFYEFFNDIAINFKFDSVASVFSFKGRFNPDNSDHRLIFKPYAYHPVEIYSNSDVLLFTGVITRTDLGSSSSRELQSLSGYSSAGVLEDVTISVDNYPLEKEGVNLQQIVRDVLSDFSFGFRVDPSAANEMTLNYEKVVAGASETVKSFISKLASQRNIVLAHDASGGLVFVKPSFRGAAKRFYNSTNVVNMNLSADGQSVHSKISVIRQPSKENPSLTPVDTIENPLVQANRAVVKILTKGDETDTSRAADNLLAAELKSLPITIVLNELDFDLKPGDLIEVQNPEIALYNPVKLVISEISLRESKSSETMTLKALLPEAFTGEKPSKIFDL